MSRSEPTLANPAQHFFQWAGSRGKLEWYDKTNQKRVEVRMPFEFLVLDELATMTGYSKLDASPYFANEVRNTTKEPFTVKTTKGVKQVGLYKDLADVRAKGAKYAKSVYIAHKDATGEYVVGNIKMSGSALTAWIEFGRNHVVQHGKIILKPGAKLTAPTGDYYPPVFEWVHSSSDEDSTAQKLDKGLQEYLRQYQAVQAEQASLWPNEPIDPELGKATPEQIADYERRKAAKLNNNAALDLGNGSKSRSLSQRDAEEPVTMPDIDLGNDDIDLDSIPF
jgi:hypothetical protein